MIMVDTCVPLDVVQDHPRWGDWSQGQLEHALGHDDLAVNPIVYAESSVWYNDLARLEQTLTAFGAVFEELPREALFLGGKALRQYRARRGARVSVLPEFFIGAHATVREMPILTRDTTRFRTCFPSVALLAPQGS